MDPEAQQYLDAAKTGIDIAHKTGILRRFFGLFQSHQSIEQPDQQLDYREEALAALRDNAVETLAGLELTTQEALQILGPDFSLGDLDKVNSTWQRHWTSGASRIGIDDEERRTWWARLVAGEIQQPGTFSLRTLAAMDTLSTREARLFTRLCAYVWNPSDPVLILPTDDSLLWKPNFDESSILESIGLVKFDSLAGFNWGIVEETAKELMSQGRSFPTVMQINEEVYFVMNTPDKLVQLRCGNLTLADVGKEMYRLTKPDYSQPYRDEILAEWQQVYSVIKAVV